jgi:hypothetical protein
MSTIIGESRMKTGFTYDVQALQKALGSIIQHHVSPDTWTWMNERKTAAIGSSDFNTAFAAMPRKTGKALVQIKDEEKNQLQNLRPGLSINSWSIDRLARVWLLLHIDASDEEKYFRSIDNLFLAAEMNELVALYSALPLLPYPERWRKRCADGIRSNIGDVLQAIMCNNPYPSEQLDEKAWNQLVLKAFFTEKPVDEIIGLDERGNQELANILSDYAHERWAAGRTINPLLWRCVGKFINASIFPDIQRIANSENEREREAAALACYDSNYEPAKKLLDTMPSIKSAIEKAELNWQTFVQKINN